MLRHNGSIVSQQPLRFIGGGAANDRAMWGAPGALANARQAFGELASIPNGYRAPSAWQLPYTAGSGNAAGFSTAVGTATGASGRNGTADASSVSTGEANGTAVSSGTATGSGAGSGSAIGVAVLSATADGSASGVGNATVTAIADGSATGSASSEGTVTPYAIAWGTATNEAATLTADQISQSVWASPASGNNTAGTMGELLNNSGAGANPWTVTLEGSYTAADLMRVIAAASSADATGLNGPSTVFKSLDGTKTRIAATVSDGTRTITTRDGTE